MINARRISYRSSTGMKPLPIERAGSRDPSGTTLERFWAGYIWIITLFCISTKVKCKRLRVRRSRDWYTINHCDNSQPNQSSIAHFEYRPNVYPLACGSEIHPTLFWAPAQESESPTIQQRYISSISTTKQFRPWRSIWYQLLCGISNSGFLVSM